VHRLILSIGLVACADNEPPAPEPPWTQRADAPSPRLEASAAGLGTKLVVLGGFEAPTLAISREVLQYDPFDDLWTVMPLAAPAAVTHAALASVGGSLYLLGGLEGSAFVPSGKAYRLPALGTAWEPLADLPAGEERGAAAVVVSSGHIFLMGGETSAGFTSSVLDYHVASNTWTVLDVENRPPLAPLPLPTPRSHAAAMREDDGTFILAGGNGPQGPLGDTYALPLGAPMWELRAPMPTARGGCAYGVLYGKLVCAGGEIGPTVTRAVEVYDPTLDEWTSVAEMPVERAGAPGAIVASRLYVVGGSQTTAFEPTTTLYEFDLLDTLPR
jgi:N-acetylneuraminic acid mutarotase